MSASTQSISMPLNSLFRAAVLVGSKTSVALHIQRGDNLDARDNMGLTPIMIAASKGKMEICRLLIEGGADLFLTDPKGRNVLEFAKSSGVHEVELLISAAIAPQSDVKPASQIDIDSTTSEKHNLDIRHLHSPADTNHDAPTNGLITDLNAHSDKDDQALGFDLSAWEVEKDTLPPSDNKYLAIAASKIQQDISDHELIDTAQDWTSFYVCLPESAIPLSKTNEESGYESLRQIFVRGMREGSIPESVLLNFCASTNDRWNADHESLLRFTLNQIGVQTDERLDFEEPHKFLEETPEEETNISEALVFLEELSSSKNDLIMMYMREMGSVELLTREGEIEIAKRIEDGLTDMIQAISACPTTIAEIIFSAAKIANNEMKIDEVVSVLVEENHAKEPSLTAALSVSKDAATLAIINESGYFDPSAKLRGQSGRKPIGFQPKDELVDELDDELDDEDENGTEEDEEDEAEEEEGNSGGAAAGFSAEQLERLKQGALEKFASIAVQFDKMRKSFEREGYNSKSYVKAQETISQELLGLRFTAKYIEKLCDTLRGQVDEVRNVEKQILEVAVKRCGIPRAHFIKVFPGNETNLDWVDGEVNAAHAYSAILSRNVPMIKELQKN